MPPPRDIVGTVLGDKLRIERALASGAAGDVYEALHLGLNTRVAVKVLRPGGGETADIRRKRFLREARVAARLRSPHVVRVFDVEADAGGTAYIVMELLRGETLAERLARAGPLPVADAVSFVRQGARALAEMHDAGMVHRDVKPSNLFLALGDPGDADAAPTVKLLDFGIAALQHPMPANEGPRESSITFSEAFVGTPRYVAPEQVRSSKDVDARADVWALAVTLHELLAGKPPFDGATVLAVLNQIERSEPPVLESLRPEVPPSLGALLRRCMSRDPEGRPADGRALLEALAPFDPGERPATTPVVAIARPRRSRGLAVIAGSIAAATLVVVIGLRRPGDAEPAATRDVPSGTAPGAAPPPGSSATAGGTAAGTANGGGATSPDDTPSPSPAGAAPPSAPSSDVAAAAPSPRAATPGRTRPEASPRPRSRPAARPASARSARPLPEDDDRIE